MAAHQGSLVAFLIDADNISPQAVDDAFESLKGLGFAVTVRRAYGGLEKLTGMKEVLRRHAVGVFVNQGKGTTDVALVVDAMDLLHRDGLPPTVAIGSSDADFAPLAVRMREAGIRVVCFAQKAKAADSLLRAYEEVFFVDEPGTQSFIATSSAVQRDMDAEIKVVRPSETPLTAKSPAMKPLQVKKAATSAVVKKMPAKKVSAKKSLVQAVQKPASGKPGVTVAEILAAAPALKAGQPQPLGEIVKLLHDAKVLAKSATSTKLFKKFPAEFEVSLKPPHQVRYLLVNQ